MSFPIGKDYILTQRESERERETSKETCVKRSCSVTIHCRRLFTQVKDSHSGVFWTTGQSVDHRVSFAAVLAGVVSYVRATTQPTASSGALRANSE